MLFDLCPTAVIVAPMGGGPSTPNLVVAAAEAGALGFLAGGYKTGEQLQAEIEAVRTSTSLPFGVNLFVPGAPAVDRRALDAYLRELEAEAAALDVELGPAAWDDDAWAAKADIVIDAAPPIVSFTFGLPPASVVDALKASGTIVMVTVTDIDEAHAAVASGAHCLCAQGTEAGAHRGSFTDDPAAPPGLGVRELTAALHQAVDVPIVAAGGIGQPQHVTDARSAGAMAVQTGTAFLRCAESGAHPAHKAALVDPTFTTTAFTRSFSGRRARGLHNRFMREHQDAPCAYPELNNATRPLRAAAAARSDTGATSLWAGTGYRDARDQPASAIIDWLAGSN